MKDLCKKTVIYLFPSNEGGSGVVWTRLRGRVVVESDFYEDGRRGEGAAV